MSETEFDHDVIIVGGGLAGASLACALADVDVNCALIESTAFGDASQPSYDERTVALTWSSRKVFEGVGVWDEIAALEATAITAISISDQGHFGSTRLEATDVGTPALGYVVPHRVLGDVFFKQIEARQRVTLHCPQTVEAITIHSDRAVVDLGQRKLTTRLVVIADGGRSGLAESVGMRAKGRDYRQQAIVATVTPDRDPAGLAYERFTSSGPLALLPGRDGSYVVAWTREPDDVEAMINASEAQFLESLQATMGHRAGKFVQASARRAYPLRLKQITSPVATRAVAIGNAAHTVHPVAGQGFNLGLRDVASLADMIHSANLRGVDFASPESLRAYAKSRRADTRSVGWITDGLIRTFANDNTALALARNTGLSIVNVLPPVRRALLRQTMGLNASHSTLSLGLPLSSINISGPGQTDSGDRDA